eukprot:gene3673-4348_t
MRVSLFVDGDGRAEPMARARATGAERVELYTGPYGGCYDKPEDAARQVELLGLTADAAKAEGLGVNAGHDLTVANLPALVRRIPHLAEVSIGHGLTADAIEHGMAETAAPVAPPVIRCNLCQAVLPDVVQLDAQPLKGIQLAYKAHCAACSQDTWAVKGEPAAVRAFYDALEKAA